MDEATLRIIHITGIVMTFIGLTGILALKMAGGAPLSKRMIFHFSHGIGLLVIIGTGFAMAGKLGVTGEPWVAGKFVIWALAAGSMMLANRFSRFAGRWWFSSSRWWRRRRDGGGCRRG